MKEVTRKTITFDAAGGYYFGDQEGGNPHKEHDGYYYNNAQWWVFRNLSKYESIEVNFEWEGLNAIDGRVYLQEGIQAHDLFVDIAGLTENLDAVAGQGALQHSDFGNVDARFMVDFGTANVGTLTAHFVCKMR